MKICPNCGKEFEPNTGQRKFCSRRCLKTYHQRKWRCKRSAEKIYKRKCPNCGAEFETHYGQKKFCSKKCAMVSVHRNEYAKVKLQQEENYPVLVCPGCGKEFKQHHGLQKYCSGRCMKNFHERQYYWQKKTANGECPNCGKKFKARRAGQIFCSHKCAQAFYQRKYYARKKLKRQESIPEATCPNCGRTFKPKTIRQKYCSPRCMRNYLKRKKYALRKLKRQENIPEATCPNCGKKFKPYRLTQKFCSKKCAVNFHAEEYRKRRREERGAIVKKCECCGAEFNPRGNHQKFCQKCSTTVINERTEGYNRLMREARAAEKLKRIARAEKAADERAKIAAMPVIRLKGCGDGSPPLPVEIKPKTHLELMMKEAAECGLSYGKYLAALKLGKTYKDLKNQYEKRLAETVPQENMFVKNFEGLADKRKIFW